MGEKNAKFDSKGTQCTKQIILHVLTTSSLFLRAYCTSVIEQIGNIMSTVWLPGKDLQEYAQRDSYMWRKEMNWSLRQQLCVGDRVRWEQTTEYVKLWITVFEH